MKAEPEGVSTNTEKSQSGTVAEELPKLLFELSHAWRLETLFAIREHAKRHSELCKDLKMSPQETTRHLMRLVEMELVQKDVGGRYHLTHIGQLVLAFVPALNVIAKYSDFFSTHDNSGIPYEYVLRMGELGNSKLQKTDTLSALSRAIQTIRETKGQIFLMNVGRLELVDSIIEEERIDIELRCILPSNLACTVPEKIEPERCRYLDEIKLVTILTNETAALCLPDLEGKMDYTTYLASKDSAFKKWCRDLFEHHWKKAKLQPERPRK